MTPYLVTPPDGLPVSASDMKAHLRVTHNDDDAEITALQAGAVAMLDGWGGVLNRCILPQTWAIDVTGPGPHLLPFPDASSVTANGDAVTAARCGAGFMVTLDAAAADETTIQATYGLSAERLPLARTLIKLVVGRDFDALAGPEYDAATRSIHSFIDTLRWRRL